MVVLVRPVEPADQQGVAAVAAARGESDYAGNPAYVAHLRAHGAFWVAERSGPVVGYCGTREFSGARMLTDLFVAPGATGGGVGRALLDVALPGAPALFTFASQDASALPLYAGYGMAPRWPLLYLSRPSPSGDAGGCRTTVAEAAAVLADLTGQDRAADLAFLGDEGVVVESGGVPVAAGVAAGDTLRHLTVVRGGPEVTLAALAGRTSVTLPGPNPALRALLAQGWRVTDFDHHMSSAEGLVDHHGVPAPALG